MFEKLEICLKPYVSYFNNKIKPLLKKYYADFLVFLKAYIKSYIEDHKKVLAIYMPVRPAKDIHLFYADVQAEILWGMFFYVVLLLYTLITEPVHTTGGAIPMYELIAQLRAQGVVILESYSIFVDEDLFLPEYELPRIDVAKMVEKYSKPKPKPSFLDPLYDFDLIEFLKKLTEIVGEK